MANIYYLSAKGSKQGELKGESGKDPTQIPILGFSYGVQFPRDSSTGQAAGKRQHKPVTIYKEWGSVSPQLYQAMVTNENLTSVVIQEVRLNAAGQEMVYMEIRLSNASIAAIAIDPERSSTPPLWTGQEIEMISITFHKIEIENKISKTTVVDDWSA